MKTGFLAATFLAAGLAAAQAAEVSGQFILVDQTNQRVNQDSYAGQVRVMAFGYTFCPDICPTSLANIAGALDQLGDQAQQVTAIFVSVDPKRDTPDHLKDYVASFGPRVVGLTGTQEMVDAAARSFKVRYQIQPSTDPKDPDAYTVDHSAGIYIMGRQGQFLSKMGYQSTPDEIATRLSEAIQK